MLSETDIHYISGFLYIASGGEIESVVLGEKVQDEASGSRRDVDIVIKTAGSVGFIGVEVKDESRKLDTTLVEQLCRKLEDMPSLTVRGIISTSGYTAPARKKAAAHGFSCLTLVHGALPPLRSIDISGIDGITVISSRWIEDPHVRLAPDVVLTEDERRALLTAAVSFPDVAAPDCTVKEVADRIARQANPGSDSPREPGFFEAKIDIVITDRPTVDVRGRVIEIDRAVVTGRVEVTNRHLPLESNCYLTDDNGEPFAATAIVKLDTGLFGLTVSRDGQYLRGYHIPDQVRRKRPTRVTIGWP